MSHIPSSVSVRDGHTGEFCKTAEPIEMRGWADWRGPEEPTIDLDGVHAGAT